MKIFKNYSLKLINLMGLLYRKIFECRKFDAMVFFQLCIYTINIVALLIGLEYFTAKSSLNVHAMNISMIGYYPELIRSFYLDNNLNLPKIFYKDKNLNRIITSKEINTFNNDLDLDRIKNKNNSMVFFSELWIEDLEKQFDKKEYKFGDGSGGIKFRFLSAEDMSIIRNMLKNRLSRKEYYIFLSASLYSRKIDNDIWIKNDGDVDLRDIIVTIPSPLSKVAGRANNILSYDKPLQSDIVHYINNMPDKLVLNIPLLKSGEVFSMIVTTRENQIANSEIIFTFKEDRIVKKQKIASYASVILISLILIKIFFKGKPRSKN